MLASVLVSAIQQAISDDTGAPRHGVTAEVLPAIGRALAELFSMHPEGFMRTDYVREAPPPPAALATDIDLDPLWTAAVVSRAAYDLLMQDSEDENNRALAQEHLKRWKEEI